MASWRYVALSLASVATVGVAWWRIWWKEKIFRPKVTKAVRGRVVLGGSGSVAAVKVPNIAKLLVEAGLRVDVVLTKAGVFFQNIIYRNKRPIDLLRELKRIQGTDGKPMVTVYCDEDEWNQYKAVRDDVVHIELAKQNQALIIAPISAHTLAKMALGISSDLLSSVIRAWYYDLSDDCDLKEKARPVIIAPAMNTYMWYQNVTKHQLKIVRDRGVEIVEPVSKLLACGDMGKGAMAEPEVIVEIVLKKLGIESRKSNTCEP